ncbi:MAG: ammonia-forming cytochrome c nitrite reductase subunit c552 [Bryobacterales bacterium]|nr:ammonia-forming cytochrome c nitrite reductase subunit c552 [Bryobacterales bacterium]
MKSSRLLYILAIALTAVATFLIVALLMNITQRKQEATQTYLPLANITEDTVDPEEWGKNFPREFDGYKRTVDTARTKYGGSEAFQKLDQDPMLKRIFAGYAFSLDYREERGHAYSLKDQDETERTKKKEQPGACLQCHASILPAYRKMGNGDIMKGFEEVCKMPFREARKLVTHPISCLDCHDPKTMALRVTRPGFLIGIKAFKKTQGVENYDPNTMATRQEMRSYVCGQCHVEYYFAPPNKTVTYPWAKGLKVDDIEAYYEEVKFTDWKHAETGAPVLKAQHPEFEMWNQGIHARSGVACADCHMPYKREGALKVSDHHVRSPILNVERACLVCHPYSGEEMKARVENIQDRNARLLAAAETALVDLFDEVKAAKAAGADDAKLEPVFKLQKRAQFRTDFIAAENSMGFHAPQEAARILGEAIDLARQGQLTAAKLKGGAPVSQTREGTPTKAETQMVKERGLKDQK